MFKALFGYQAALDELDACKAMQAAAIAEADRNRRRYDKVLAELSSVREYYRAQLAASAEQLDIAVAEQGRIRMGFLAEMNAAGELAEESTFARDQCRAECKQAIEGAEAAESVAMIRAKKAEAELRAQCELTEGAAADVGSALIRADAAEAELAASHIRETLLKKLILSIRAATFYREIDRAD